MVQISPPRIKASVWVAGSPSLAFTGKIWITKITNMEHIINDLFIASPLSRMNITYASKEFGSFEKKMPSNFSCDICFTSKNYNGNLLGISKSTTEYLDNGLHVVFIDFHGYSSS
jgi:hypothetical protein